MSAHHLLKLNVCKHGVRAFRAHAPLFLKYSQISIVLILILEVIIKIEGTDHFSPNPLNENRVLTSLIKCLYQPITELKTELK